MKHHFLALKVGEIRIGVQGLPPFPALAIGTMREQIRAVMKVIDTHLIVGLYHIVWAIAHPRASAHPPF